MYHVITPFPFVHLLDQSIVPHRPTVIMQVICKGCVIVSASNMWGHFWIATYTATKSQSKSVPTWHWEVIVF